MKLVEFYKVGKLISPIRSRVFLKHFLLNSVIGDVDSLLLVTSFHSGVLNEHTHTHSIIFQKGDITLFLPFVYALSAV